MSMLGLFLMLAVASAQAQTKTKLVAHIPFDFQVADRLLPAGTYAVEEVSASGKAVVIRKTDGRQRMIVSTDAVQAMINQTGRARLIFRRYDNQFFLSAVWEDAANGRVIYPSRSERNVRRELAQNDKVINVQTLEIVASMQ